MSIQVEKARELNIDFTLRIEDELTYRNICTDRLRFQQVLLNYQSNALKFTPKRGKVSIDCSFARKDGHYYVKVSVSDTGVGISEEDQERLFKLFGYLESK